MQKETAMTDFKTTNRRGARTRTRLGQGTLVVAAIAVIVSLAASGNAAAQCIYTPYQPQGFAYPLHDWRVIDEGDLPQTSVWDASEDKIEVRVDDGTSLGLAMNQMQITLVIDMRKHWQKQIFQWNSRTGNGRSISTPGPFDGGVIVPPDGLWRVSMRITKASCGAETIVFVKARWGGTLSPVYHLDPNNFWTLWGGKSVTFTWVDDSGSVSGYPAPCSSPCVPLGRLAPITPVKKLAGDFDGDFKTDIALTGVAGWSTLPVAFSKGDGTFRVTNSVVTNAVAGDFAGWASTPGVKALVGRFDADSRADIVLTGGAGWNTVPVAFSNGGGTFRVTNLFVGDFAGWASSPRVKALVGDFNGDGLSDVALTGVAGWQSLPVAFSNGDGTFRVTNSMVTNVAPGDFAGWASTPGVKAWVGDFDNDGYADIALTGGAGWNTLPVAFSNGNGTFRVTNFFVGDFAAWASPAVKKLVGDFNNDGRTDIALIGGTSWDTLPVAFSNGNGTFNVTNRQIGFSTVGAAPRWMLEAVTGDFDGDHKADVAIFHPNSFYGRAWMFRSNGDGSFETRTSCVGYFGGASNELYATKLVGDFNSDGKADVALTGMSGWNTLPVALGAAPSNFVGPAGCYIDFGLRNFPISDFAGWAAQ
jgi:hypothetical protein